MKRLVSVGLVALSALAWTSSETPVKAEAGANPEAAVKSKKATGDGENFLAEDAFEVKGTLKKRTAGALTLSREHLPSAVLTLRPQTQVFVDGKKAQVKQLEDGVEVRALFQLDGEKAVAVRVEATSRTMKERGTGGSGLDADFKSDIDRMSSDPARNNEVAPAAEAAEREVKEPTESADEAW